MTLSLRNNTWYATSDASLRKLREAKWKLYEAEIPMDWEVQGTRFKIRPGLTFTPFANPVKCNAHCTFCSEELVRKNGHVPTANALIQSQDVYFETLVEVVRLFKKLPMGLSISGLEATADPEWLERCLTIISAMEPEVQFDEKVLYTNGSGLYNHHKLIPILEKNRINKIEISRCHYNEQVNQSIMRFNKNQPIRTNNAYENLVANEFIQKVGKNTCILSKDGIHSVIEIERYLDWVVGLGIQTVVFREISRIDATYVENATSSWINENRVEIDSILNQIAPAYDSQRDGWKYQYSTVGYYYYNEHYRWRNSVEVILETSSYPALLEANASGVLQKLIFHSNGNLTGDWDASKCIVANFTKVIK